jgi:hypothetical protein
VPLDAHCPQRNGEAFADPLRIAAINDEPVFTERGGRQSFDLIAAGNDELVFQTGGPSNARRYRRCISANPLIGIMWRYRGLSVVHAQVSSTNRVLRSRWTEVSRGDCIFPFGFDNLAWSRKQQAKLLKPA